MFETKSYLKRELFTCDCEDLSHQFVITKTDDLDFPFITIEVKLNYNVSFWKRLVNAFRYLFKMTPPSRFGDYDEIILKKEDAERLQIVVDELRKL